MRGWSWVALIASLSCGGGSRGTGGPAGSEANEQSAAACEAGDANACSILATSLYLDARANDTSLEPSLHPFLKACEREEWLGCGMAAIVKAALNQDSRPIAAKAFPIAMSACQRGESDACTYVADWAAKAEDRITAAVHYRTACEIEVEACGERSMDEYSCRKAVEFGVAPHLLEAKVKPENSHSQARRVRGEKDIQPPMREARGMCELRLAKLTARFILCLSETGVPSKIMVAEHSGARRWDQKLFETMRTWRYTPYLGDGGKPEPVCTGVTFHYRPRC